MTIVKAIREYARDNFPEHIFKGNTIAGLCREVTSAKKGTHLSVSALLAPNLTDLVAAKNNKLVTSVVVNQSEKTITITGPVTKMNESTSSNASQGTHKWLGLGIGCGANIPYVKYNGSALTAEDDIEARIVGLPSGYFILYLRAEELTSTPKTITLAVGSDTAESWTISVVDPDDTSVTYTGTGETMEEDEDEGGL